MKNISSEFKALSQAVKIAERLADVAIDATERETPDTETGAETLHSVKSCLDWIMKRAAGAAEIDRLFPFDSLLECSAILEALDLLPGCNETFVSLVYVLRKHLELFEYQLLDISHDHTQTAA